MPTRKLLYAAVCAMMTLGVSIGRPSRGAEPSQFDVLAPTSATAGLAVHAGTTDGALETSLASGGRLLVHGLARDDQSRDKARAAIRAAGLCGLASVETAWGRSFQRLPYADNLVNLLVADLDALGPAAPPQEEILRVICPNGTAWLKRGGRWEKLVKPRPAGMDEWTHFDYGPDGNAVSHDKLVRPPTQLQWISGVQPMKLGGNPAGFVGSLGFRITGGRAFSDWATEGKNRTAGLAAWDAFSGVPLWRTERAFWGGRRPVHLAAVGDRVFTFRGDQGPLVALDAATGEERMAYDQAGRLPRNTGLASFRVSDGKLIVANQDRLAAIDAATGRLAWQHREPDGANLLFPTVSAAAGRVFVLASQVQQDGKIEYRWPNAPVAAVLCLDLAAGRSIWRNTDVAGKHVGQIVHHGDYVGLFGAGGIGAGKEPFVGNLRASDGKLLWTGAFPTTWNRAGYAMLWRDGAMYYADPWKIFRLDPATGKETPVFGEGYNGRCMRFCATDDWLIHSFVAFVDKDFRGTLQSVARSACANSVFPANGLLYFTPNACGCLTMIRGHLALTPEPLREPMDDALRWQPLAASPPAAVATARRAEKPQSTFLRGDWTRQDRAPGLETEPVRAGGRSLVAVIHEHRMECRDAPGNVLWAFTAGARISSPPVVHEGLCLFGSHDGWVYAVRLSDGAPAWRFLAAPYERRIVAYGQVESPWPVYGVVMHEGLVCASAGLHAELGGGISVVGLEPRSGKLVWKRVLKKSPAVLQGTERIGGRIVPNSALNDVLQSDGKLLSLPAGRGRLFAFDPRWPDDKLKALLETAPAKKK